MMTKVISFTSGKGGVGKSNCVINTAVALSKLGKSVLILDADLGLANIDILLGIQARYTINDVLRGERQIEEIMVDGPERICVIPAASGIESITELRPSDRMVLRDAIEEVSLDFDYLLIDTRAGISSDVMFFNSASSEVIVVINNEPTSLTDAYALIKVLCQNYGEKRFSILANDVLGPEEGMAAFKQLAKVVERYLHAKLSYLGHVPHDPLLGSAVMQQRALVELYPSSRAGLAFLNLARKIEGELAGNEVKGGMQFLFKQLLEIDVNNLM